MIKFRLQLPLGITLSLEICRSVDPAEIASAVWTEQFREPPYIDDDDTECDCQ
ncbi:hypothetical protein [Nocardia wallacei]|uniref:hypothetical protein n=1 Tax=Nocardia wallacei TaxID=480035 RepID=UPI002457EAAC|nr:hypothetical protein [Nocardia wallacei]